MSDFFWAPVVFAVFSILSTLSPAVAQDGGEITLGVVEVTTGSGSRTGAVTEVIELLPPVINQADALSDPLNFSENFFTDSNLADELEPSVFTALNAWQTNVLLNYNFMIGDLSDPFMPIKEVRGKPDELGSASPTGPPILRMELNQLKLVAITVLSDRPGGSLASFEDQTGTSYILRQG
ncbi:MAG: hypothetical protein ACRCTY_08070, partial [Candidatus Adiutrix sp.]